MKTTKHLLSAPPLEELANTIRPALADNYQQASIDVVQCPDLRQPPFNLATSGLSGQECIADIGGQPHLFPCPLVDKKYDMLACATAMELPASHGSLIGAGAGPFHLIGQNSELAPNLSWKDGFRSVENKTHYAMVSDVTDGKARVTCGQSPSCDCALMMNLYGSLGQAGPVLKITAKARKGEQGSFTECIRRAVNQAYGNDRQVSLGGVFVIKRGKALYHVMPDFPPEDQLPFRNRHHLNDWLTYHTCGAPMTCLTVFHSADPEKLGLRMEHTHCFSCDGKSEGGHYHHDVPAGDDGAEEVEYEGYSMWRKCCIGLISRMLLWSRISMIS